MTAQKRTWRSPDRTSPCEGFTEAELVPVAGDFLRPEEPAGARYLFSRGKQDGPASGVRR